MRTVSPPASADPGAAAAVERATLVRYALGSAGMGVYVTVPGLLLLYFLTDTLGVSPWLAGLTLLVPKVVDVVLHPFVGTLSDTDRRRRGTRLRLLVVGCLLGPAFLATFAVPGVVADSQYLAALWVGGWFVLGNTLFASYQVPYLATPTDVAVGYDERTRIMSFRMIVLTVGILISGAVAPLLAGEDSGVGGYVVMAAALGAFMLVFQVIGVGGVRRLAPAAGPSATAGEHRPAREALTESISVLRANPSFRILVTSYLLMSTTTHLVLAGLPYFAEYELDRPAFTTILMAAFMAPALLTTPLWFRLSRSWGKQRCLLAAQALFVVGSLVLLVGARLGLVLVVLATLALGVAFAGLQLFPFSMVPDTVRAGGDAELARAGAYTGVWTATEAVGAAAGPYLYSAALALGGFVASTADEDVVQTDGARLAVLLGFTLISAVVMGLSLLSQRRYRLDGAAQTAPAPVA